MPLPFLTLALACSSGAGGPADGPGTTDRCSGDYVCYIAATDYQYGAALHRANGECYLHQMLLGDDGQAVGADGSQGTWRYTEAGFETCFDGTCSECSRLDNSNPGTSGSSRCHGSARSCSSLSGGCEDEVGCYPGYSVSYDGSLKVVCKGTARSCSSFSDQSQCERQGSCYWE